MLVTILIFLILLLVAAGAWHLLPPPFDWLIGGIVVLVAVAYLVMNLDSLEDADAAVSLARSSWS
jgi:hypothetical protein